MTALQKWEMLTRVVESVFGTDERKVLSKEFLAALSASLGGIYLGDSEFYELYSILLKEGERLKVA